MRTHKANPRAQQLRYLQDLTSIRLDPQDDPSQPLFSADAGPHRVKEAFKRSPDIFKDSYHRAMDDQKHSPPRYAHSSMRVETAATTKLNSHPQAPSTAMASEHKLRPMSILSSKFELTPEKQLISHDTLPPELRAGKATFKAVQKSPSPVKEVVKGKRTISRWDSRHRKKGAKNFYGQPFNRRKESPQVEEGVQKQENFKASLMNNNQKAIQFHRFFHENFTQVRDLDLRELEKKLDYPRDEIIANFIAYISLSKLLASQNLKVTNLKGQTQFLEKMKRGGLTFDQLRNVFPHLRYENHFIIDKIFNSAMNCNQTIYSFNASVTGHSLEMNQFLKCAGALKCGSFEQKVQILLDVIDFEGKGYLTWRDLKNLCKQYLCWHYIEIRIILFSAYVLSFVETQQKQKGSPNL